MERVLANRMPLLNLLQNEPLQIQASHLAFQEFYCARAICNAAPLPTQPWKFTSWWSNILKLGDEMGLKFRQNLLRAAGVEGLDLDLTGELGGHRSTALLAVKQIISVLTSLDLTSNMLTASCVATIVEALDGNTTLSTLVLDTNEMGDQGAAALAAGVLGCEALVELSICSCSIGPTGAAAIARTLELNTTLTSLQISSNPIGDHGGLALGQGLRLNAHLAEVELRDCGIRAVGMKAIGRALAKNQSLTNMDISGNQQLSEEDMRVFGSSLLHNDRAKLGFIVCDSFVLQEGLHALDLSSRGVCAAYATTLSGVLKSNGVLTTLVLNDNDIRDEGAVALAHGLSHNRALELLELNGCAIKAEGAKALGRALETNDVLTKVDLRNNRLGDDGVLEIGRSLLNSAHGVLCFFCCDALSIDEDVSSLDFSREGITHVRARLLAGIVRANATLTALDLYRQLDVDSAKALARCFGSLLMPSNPFRCLPMPSHTFRCLPMPSRLPMPSDSTRPLERRLPMMAVAGHCLL